MKSRFIALVITALIQYVSLTLLAGWSGNGGNSLRESNNLWFLGDEPIPYCVSMNSVDLTAGAFEQMLQRNILKWNQFLHRYSMDEHTFGVGDILFPDQKSRTQSKTFLKAANCKEVLDNCTSKFQDEGKCYDSLTDKVLFIVGTPNLVVKKYLEINGSAAGVAIRTEYNHKTYRSGGIVWIDKQKNNGWSFYSHMLLHELGHVFGMKHDSCWVMASNVAAFASHWIGVGDLEKIEAPNWPYSYKDGDELLFTDFKSEDNSIPQGYTPIKYLAPQFQKIFGFESQNYFQVSGIVSNSNGNGIKLTLKITEFPSQKMHTLEGNLNAALVQTDQFLLSPELYTVWVHPQLPKNQFFSSEYVMEGYVAPFLQGAIRWNDVLVPVTLRRQKGLSISLFLPNATEWFTLSTLKSNPALRVQSR